MLCGSLFSAIFAQSFPGSVYLSQNLKFIAPVRIDETITARVTVQRIFSRKRILDCETKCIDSNGINVIEGSASVLLPSLYVNK